MLCNLTFSASVFTVLLRAGGWRPHFSAGSFLAFFVSWVQSSKLNYPEILRDKFSFPCNPRGQKLHYKALKWWYACTSLWGPCPPHGGAGKLWRSSSQELFQCWFCVTLNIWDKESRMWHSQVGSLKAPINIKDSYRMSNSNVFWALEREKNLIMSEAVNNHIRLVPAVCACVRAGAREIFPRLYLDLCQFQGWLFRSRKVEWACTTSSPSGLGLCNSSVKEISTLRSQFLSV